MMGPREDRGERWPKRGLHALAFLALFTVGMIGVNRVAQFALKPYRIPSSAMEPTLHCARPASGCEAAASDRIFVLRLHPFWTPSRSDVVAFHTPDAARVWCGSGGTFVKRVIGLPGETVSARNRSVAIDGRRLPEPYIESGRRGGQPGTWRVPADAYFVMGDNRQQSCDSRVFGSVPRDKLIGPVAAAFWPPDRIGVR